MFAEHSDPLWGGLPYFNRLTALPQGHMTEPSKLSGVRRDPRLILQVLHLHKEGKQLYQSFLSPSLSLKDSRCFIPAVFSWVSSRSSLVRSLEQCCRGASRDPTKTIHWLALFKVNNKFILRVQSLMVSYYILDAAVHLLLLCAVCRSLLSQPVSVLTSPQAFLFLLQHSLLLKQDSRSIQIASMITWPK